METFVVFPVDSAHGPHGLLTTVQDLNKAHVSILLLISTYPPPH